MTEITKALNTGSLEALLVQGDLSKLNSKERLDYYLNVCDSLGLNPTTTPFSYIRLNGKLTLYATKACTDQLRRIYGVSITKCEASMNDGIYCVVATGSDKTGRTDTEMGAVSMGRLQGDAKANAMMKAQTKAKRRLTLSLCGLGMLDETEVETIPNAQTQTPEIAHQQQQPEPVLEAATESVDAEYTDSSPWSKREPGETELYNSHTYVERVEKPMGSRKPWRITLNEPVGDENGATGERKVRTMTTFDGSLGRHAEQCRLDRSPIEYKYEVNGDYTNITEVIVIKRTDTDTEFMRGL